VWLIDVLFGVEIECDWHWPAEREYGCGGELDCYGMDMLADVLGAFGASSKPVKLCSQLCVLTT
jgi:hypothetical protein